MADQYLDGLPVVLFDFRMELINIKTDMYHDGKILKDSTMFYATKYKVKLNNLKWRIDHTDPETEDDARALQLETDNALEALTSNHEYNIWKERMRASGDPCTETNPLIQFNPELVKNLHNGSLQYLVFHP
jgi:hypothetical protein